MDRLDGRGVEMVWVAPTRENLGGLVLVLSLGLGVDDNEKD